MKNNNNYEIIINKIIIIIVIVSIRKKIYIYKGISEILYLKNINILEKNTIGMEFTKSKHKKYIKKT